MKYDYLIVGAGFAGSVAAERLASQQNKKVLIVEKRSHIGGNAYDEFDDHGILIHKYGPHIFHTNSKEVFEYLSQFTEWIPYEHKVLAKLDGELYPIPINRNTINKLYNLELTTDAEVEKFYEKVREKRNPILNSEDLIVNKVGYDLFEKFYKNYTYKQWGMEANELSPSICGRIPVRTNCDDRYFTDKYQFMPKDGYTKMFENILSYKNIEVVLNTDYKDIINNINFDKMIYTGPIDSFFDNQFGRLPYRSIRFEWEYFEEDRFQEASVINLVDKEGSTRISEYKKITQQTIKGTTISREFPYNDDQKPYYPIISDENEKISSKYKDLAEQQKNAHFVGRLAEYKYYNMDQVVAKILSTIRLFR